jgi:hypothetical protein
MKPCVGDVVCIGHSTGTLVEVTKASVRIKGVYSYADENTFNVVVEEWNTTYNTDYFLSNAKYMGEHTKKHHWNADNLTAESTW